MHRVCTIEVAHGLGWTELCFDMNCLLIEFKSFVTLSLFIGYPESGKLQRSKISLR